VYRLRWDEVKYEPGELRVVAYKNGKRWAEAAEKTAGQPAALELSPDRPTLRADGCDLAFVSVAVRDAVGTLAPRANHTVRFSLDGPGVIVATDNGDPTSFESFQATQRHAFNGRALVIIRTKAGAPGKLTVRAEADGLASATCSLESVSSSGTSPRQESQP
jgi:beta-galactosidase